MAKPAHETETDPILRRHYERRGVHRLIEALADTPQDFRFYRNHENRIEILRVGGAVVDPSALMVQLGVIDDLTPTERMTDEADVLRAAGAI